MLAYNIWRIAGGTQSWIMGDAKGSTPAEALRNEATTGRYPSMYGDGEIFLVAARNGGHGQAAVIKLDRSKPDPLVASFVTVVRV